MTLKQYLDFDREAERIGCSVRTLKRAVAEGNFPFVRFGRLIRFDPELSDQYLAARAFSGRAAELAAKKAA